VQIISGNYFVNIMMEMGTKCVGMEKISWGWGGDATSSPCHSSVHTKNVEPSLCLCRESHRYYLWQSAHYTHNYPSYNHPYQCIILSTIMSISVWSAYHAQWAMPLQWTSVHQVLMTSGKLPGSGKSRRQRLLAVWQWELDEVLTRTCTCH